MVNLYRVNHNILGFADDCMKLIQSSFLKFNVFYICTLSVQLYSVVTSVNSVFVSEKIINNSAIPMD